MNETEYSPEEIITFKEEFEDKVRELNHIGRADLPDIDTRNSEVDDLLDMHLGVTGEIPDHNVITLLADYVLADDIKDSNPHKTTQTEYPIQSTHSRRNTPKRELSVSAEILDYLHSKYTKQLDNLSKVSHKNRDDV